MKDEIEEFINRRFGEQEVKNSFLNGNCYWFAHILITRFPQLQIYYAPVPGHFVAGDGKVYYDAAGRYKEKTKLVLFKDLWFEEPEWSRRIIRDCVN